MKRFLIVFAALFLWISSMSSLAFAEEKQKDGTKSELADEAKSAVLIERDTGAVLYDKNSHERLPPASMTKIMTMILIMEAIQEGRLHWNDKVRTSEKAASMGGSQVFLEPGEEMTVKEMLKAIAVGSANDASIAMAEHIAGSEEEFVKMMNKKAKELGLKDTKFQNPTGLPAKGHYSSAYDMALMAKELLKYPQITKYTGLYESYLRENTDKKFWLVNTNKLVKHYPGVDGLKTGFTNDAKYCLTATAKKNNMRVIAVVFGAPTPKSRNTQISKMLDYAFARYETSPIYGQGETLGQVKISKGKKSKIDAKTAESVSVLIKKGEALNKLQRDIHLKKDIKAPVHKGDKIGELVLKKDGKILSKTPLISEENVAKAGWWQYYKKAFNLFTKAEE
ncbi:D-alanyl-D-alanine carboxypeptidase family protein [Bacillus smithii]|jgi:D-alanyl-D-alanine carboxypeptidase (penicillin-binding protein 5/6)|uniref:D-alanyl-D-alanine carboxypeptidase family protein n=1 Tax=Bacillus smithii TaxID=1479 RepID=UPI002E230AF1|nr:D-alanyl-D-alanine carboxypeptidase [Bacillus smithii]MED1418966.1 D-alanyl-D-alanine carboxypeptidase [Bacillus smithii]MED1455222.1 D-alanyl-D-alanine carboxypeptidase [Bacillus smithii]MED1487860.1 D-alanyl-D-alanine carboxypeptidase [Bacillus smithii]